MLATANPCSFPDETGHSQPNSPPGREYLLSEVAAQALFAVQQHAASSSRVELLLLIHFAAHWARTGETTIRASSRELANHCGCERKNVQTAITELSRRILITVRDGGPKTPSVIRFNYLETISTGAGTSPAPQKQRGVDSTPPLKHGGVKTTPAFPQRHASERRHSDATFSVDSTPPPVDQQQLFDSAPRVHRSTIEGLSQLEVLIDRLGKADAKTVDPDLLLTVRQRLQSHVNKWAQAETWKPSALPAPLPDNKLAAELLSLAEPHGGPQALLNTLQELLFERRVPQTWGWFKTVVAQRLYKLDPATLREGFQRATAPRFGDLDAGIVRAAALKRLK